ncbi:MAG: family N-acetyltransferase [Schlesneria sp.]|nr:family N-acetyltransferase [Schlesneria sp.]
MTNGNCDLLRYREVHLTLDPTMEELNDLYCALNDPTTVPLWRGDKGLWGKVDFAERFQEWVRKEFGFYFFVRHARSGLGGCVFEYSRSLQHGYSKVTIVLDTKSINRGVGPIATALFVDCLFRNCRIDRVLMEVYGFNATVVQMLRSLGRHLRQPIEESCLKDHHYWDGKYWDFHTFVLRRNQWPFIANAILPNHAMNP